MNELTLSFAPNKVLSKSATTLLLYAQVALLLVLWTFFPLSEDLGLRQVLDNFRDLFAEGMGGHMWVSVTTNLQAIALSMFFSLLIAYASVMPAFRPVVGLFSKLRFLSLGAGLMFFFQIMASGAHVLKLYALVFSISVFFVTGFVDVIAQIPKEKFDLGRTLGFGEWRVVWEVVVLGQMDKMLDVVRQNAAIGWSILMMVEAKERSEGGIGGLLANQDKHFHLAAIVAIQLFILAMGLVQDYWLGLMKQLLCPYAALTLERR